MYELSTRPSNWKVDLERYAASVIVTVTCNISCLPSYSREELNFTSQDGRRVHDIFEDQVVAENRQSTGVLTSLNIPGKYLVESVPALLWLPHFLSPWRKIAMEQRKRDVAYYTRLVKEVQEKMADGTAALSFCRQLLETKDKHGMTDLEIAYTCGTPFGAGVDTSSGTLMVFLLACAEYGPSFIPKAQAELDAVVGTERLPTFEDLPDLPYIQAILNETLRWRPIAVLGVGLNPLSILQLTRCISAPKSSTEDDTYQGMFIPKGSTLIANLWSIHLNPDDFPDPHRFDPERFMAKREYPGQWGHSAFGFGRRICPGMHLASNSIFINIARILWGFNVGKAIDEVTGQEIPVDIFAFTNGFNSLPEPFEVTIAPRSLAHTAVIAKENEAAQEELKQFP
ncbi:hypothetical protein P7C70_g2246, partial [Phenoliferia sp. Uapishka_3]